MRGKKKKKMAKLNYELTGFDDGRKRLANMVSVWFFLMLLCVGAAAALRFTSPGWKPLILLISVSLCSAAFRSHTSTPGITCAALTCGHIVHTAAPLPEPPQGFEHLTWDWPEHCTWAVTLIPIIPCTCSLFTLTPRCSPVANTPLMHSIYSPHHIQCSKWSSDVAKDNSTKCCLWHLNKIKNNNIQVKPLVSCFVILIFFFSRLASGNKQRKILQMFKVKQQMLQPL